MKYKPLIILLIISSLIASWCSQQTGQKQIIQATPTAPKTATPLFPFFDLFSTPNVEYFLMTQVEIANRSGKLVSVRDVPGMYYPNTSIPSIVIGWLAPGTHWYIEQTYQIGSDVWARLASQESYFPLLYNGVYFTNWRAP